MSAMTRVAVVSAIALFSGLLLDHAPSGSRVEARGTSVRVRVSPDDATININNSNASRDPRLMTYTWPDRRVANAIVLKFDLSSLPAGAVVEDATLRLALIESDRKAETVYTITAHKIAGRDPVIAAVTGYVADGVRRWTANACCYNGAPMAQADISPPYDTRPVDKIRGDKTWNLTAMVREWLAEPSTNFGVLLNSDKTLRKDRYRFFASMEHSTAALRPYLDVTYSLPAGDTTAPSVALTAPAAGAVLSGPARIEANATDNVGVAGVQFYVDGAPLGIELTSPPYAVDWDTAGAADGTHLLTAVARDAAGNAGTSAAVAVQTANGTLTLTPDDTSLNVDANNYSTNPMLSTYTWPDNKVANAIVLKFDVSAVPAGATIQEATLHLALVESDAAPEVTYTVTAHKIVGRNAMIAAATGYSADGVNEWTPNASCYNGVPLAQADISMAYDTRAIDKTPGRKTWTITSLVQDWLADPASNFGVLLNSDASALRDRYRFFASMEHPDAALRPFLTIRFSRPAEDTTAPVISALAPTNVTSTSALVVWTTNERADSQVEYGTSTAYGSVTPVEGALVTAHAMTLSGLRDATQYYYRVRSRDAAGNEAVSAAGTFKTLALPDITPPAVSITAPAGGSPLSGTSAVSATASDNVGVAGVQFKLNGANLGSEDLTAPYSVSWDTTAAAEGAHTLTAVARDAAGNVTTSPAVGVTVSNGLVLQIPPQDTSLTLDATAHHLQPTLTTYTWPSNKVANAILMKFDLAGLPPGAVVQDATLHLALVESDAQAEATYMVAAHRVEGRNTVIAAATGYTADGVTAWTPNACCSNNVPLAQADISAPYDTQAIDKTAGFKVWTLTTMVQEWAQDPASNFGVLLNSDATKAADRYRFFASMEHLDPGLRPFLRVRYTIPPPDPVPPTVSVSAPIAGATVSGTVTVSANASDNVGVASVQFQLDGANLGARDTTAPFSISWNTGTVSPGAHTIRAVARDAAGNATTSAGVIVTVADVTAPAVAITAPAAGASVSGTIAVSANATDAGGLAGVQFRRNGVNLGPEDTTAPYSVSWNTTLASDGSHTLTAVARDAAGNLKTSSAVAVTVSNTAPPPSAAWPNEPGGFTAIEETGWETGSLGNWYRIFTSGDKPISVGSITGSLIGEARALQIDFAQGHVGGGGTELRYDIPSAQRSNELYVGFYVQVNPQWQGHSSGINKLVYLHDGGSEFAAMWYEMFGSGSNPLDLYVVNQSGSSPSGFRENVNEITFARGQWHRVEIYQKQGASNNGVVRVWVNGVLAIDRSDIDTRSTPVDNVTISGIWGGVGDSKDQADFMKFDRIRISRPGSGTAPSEPVPATTLLQEGFEDGSLAGRGWYDGTTPLLSTTEHVTGSLRSIEFKFNAGATTPTAASTLRRKFTPSDSVYLRYYVKYSANWVGSQRAYHPHEFHFLTSRDGDWSGLSFNRLTVYVEQTGGTPLIGIQDGANVDQARIGQNLTSTTENRGVAGCNGSSDGYPDNCYMGGSGYVNEKKWQAASRYFTDTAGPLYKNDWHMVEAFIKLNTIAGGKGVNDGVVQYWYDGQLIIDRRDVLLRTGANATMQFNQFVIAPYIGDGSPVTQSMWVDNLMVATARP